MGTRFSDVYNRFLGKITDDMYMELTPQDTINDLQRLLIDAIPGFEFPRKNLMEYTIETVEMDEEAVSPNDFIIGVMWQDMPEELEWTKPKVVVDNSSFAATLTTEEINILAILMMQNWVQRQVTSIENTRMKYSGNDFKFTSQANHLSKLMSLLSDCKTQSIHMQRLYKRRKIIDNGEYRSNWSILREISALD